MTGRKCHILADTLGFLHGLHVTPATVQDRDGAKDLLAEAMSVERAPARIYADGGYGGDLETWVLENTPTRLEIVRRDPEAKGFAVLPKRWIVERTFAWASRHRRIRVDYDGSLTSPAAWFRAGMIRLMAGRR